MSAREERIKFGNEQEEKVAEYIRGLRPDYSVTPARMMVDWTPYDDLLYGDIWLKKGPNILYFDVKRGNKKGYNGVSFQSIRAYKGDYFIFTGYDFSPDTSYVIRARVMKNYADTVKYNGDEAELLSGSPGFHFKPANIRAASKLSTFIKNFLP